ncbi:MAG: prolyl oligopeptidase family serine peptidase [Polyangiaceae bacterium]|nr:prolyl oligopeptidase family serine peptidase [Polyangiaceae bacterium]
MNQPVLAPCGTWSSPLTAAHIASASLRLVDVALDEGETYWVEMRPSEQGRYVVVRRAADGTLVEINPAPYSARTRVHEYGGRSFCVVRGKVYFVSFADQRLYIGEPGREPRAVTEPGPYRYADFAFDDVRSRILCVREDHGGPGEAVASVVALELGEDGCVDRQVVLAEGHDFFACPRPCPDGSALSWLSWDHPCMPWDGTTLWVAEVTQEGALRDSRALAGGIEESLFQPSWSPQGTLYFVSDRSGWWNLYRWQRGVIENVLPMDAEFGAPLWSLGTSRFGFVNEHEIVCHFDDRGIGRLARLDLHNLPARMEPIDTGFTAFGQIAVSASRVVCLAGSPRDTPVVLEIVLPSGTLTPLRQSLRWDWGDDHMSVAEPMTFRAPNSGGESHALFYPPRNPGFAPLSGELPPLVVMSHGGPTGATSSALKLEIQFWTTRGFAVADVNYGGSTGYGRAYRDRLKGRWGEVDVQDCMAAARHLVDSARVDPERLVIRGGSAGGYTTLAALTFHDTFKAGASYYGVSDLEALAKDTHKFESRYLDSLVAPYPEGRDVYVARSPIHHAARLSCPVIFFQGLEDRMVPPGQAIEMVEVLRAKGVRVAFIPFEGEQHGFRRAESIRRALEEELTFYLEVFGLARSHG